MIYFLNCYIKPLLKGFQKLKILCLREHRITLLYNNFQQGKGCRKCFFENNRGSNHPQWNGGTSFEFYPIEFTKNLKDEIKKRDNYTCQNPDCSKKTKLCLCIHHIDYIKENCSNINLITLCNSCNSRANTDREKWKLMYQNIIEEKYAITVDNFKYYPIFI